jgi:hypothetical protein
MVLLLQPELVSTDAEVLNTALWFRICSWFDVAASFAMHALGTSSQYGHLKPSAFFSVALPA